MRKCIWLCGALLLTALTGQAQDVLSVEKIMRDPAWMGTFPSSVNWTPDGKKLYFGYNPEGNAADSLYVLDPFGASQAEKMTLEDQRMLIPRNAVYNPKKTQQAFVRSGDLYLHELKTGTQRLLLSLPGSMGSLTFSPDGKEILFIYSNNAYRYTLATGALERISYIQSGAKPKESSPPAHKHDRWVQEENLELLQVVRERKTNSEASAAYRKATSPTPEGHFLNGKAASAMQVAPNGRYITFSTFERAENKGTIVPDYAHSSGYTTNLQTRTKVGDKPATVDMYIYDTEKHEAKKVDLSGLPGIQDKPDFLVDYPEKEWPEQDRVVFPSAAVFSPDGTQAVVSIRAYDNKDRWIVRLDWETAGVEVISRQRDEAWVAGPGIGFTMGTGTLGWLADSRHVYFQSEETGFSHLYLYDIRTGQQQALTTGNFEVFDPQLSRDEKFWYFTSSEEDPGLRHFYKMPVMGGKAERLTSLTGNNEVALSPDEKYLAIRYSYSNVPWELYLQEAKAGSKPKKLTYGQSEEFQAYPWYDPEIIRFRAADGAQVPARIYRPDPEKKNGAAVIFVHGAGYLQNVHYWWSTYFREFMFHNLLREQGYTVLDIDYRASAGYGRDWRTGIYRHMGGKDLSDQVDGAKYLMEVEGVRPGKIGIYGGSYGGFITLMALFTAADTFTAGAALRSVTDWAHYNHGYTANILNEPADDPIAYRRSSPIYFAEGLKGHLLIAHGMLDVNVHFQDVVRLAQRLIELEKDNWEMAVYPIEDHGFVEPSSWTDEYKRILKLFNDTLQN
ncbi:MAG: prolyl oligopeptidase family serine peptidase [Nitritalea sp.]